MSRCMVTFRGERVEVEYVDYGYEYDTNSHVIDWNFIDLDLPDPTDEEMSDIYLQLMKIGQQTYEDD